MRLFEIFDSYLAYDMWGWISPSGVVKLPTRADAESRELVSHIDMQEQLGLGGEYETAFHQGWIRWYLKQGRLCFNCFWQPHTAKVILKAVLTIKTLMKMPKRFRHFQIAKGSKTNLTWQVLNSGSKAPELWVDSYEIEITMPYPNAVRIYLQDKNLSTMLSAAQSRVDTINNTKDTYENQ